MSEVLKTILAKRQLLENRPQGMSLARARKIVGELLDRAIAYDQKMLSDIYCFDEFRLPQTPDKDQIAKDCLFYQNIVEDPSGQFTKSQKEIATLALNHLKNFIQSM